MASLYKLYLIAVTEAWSQVNKKKNKMCIVVMHQKMIIVIWFYIILCSVFIVFGCSFNLGPDIFITPAMLCKIVVFTSRKRIATFLCNVCNLVYCCNRWTENGYWFILMMTRALIRTWFIWWYTCNNSWFSLIYCISHFNCNKICKSML
jgi:membrane-associated HD superfamily phosphohydrolase